MEFIEIKGVKTNNLKNINIDIPKNKLIVVTGPSGSGKSSLAMDTIYAEGRRRYISSLSSYGKQMLGQAKSAEFDSIKSLTPTIAINQKNIIFNPRSTVGTVTEINDHLRLLWSRMGTVFCPEHGVEIKENSIDSLVKQILEEYHSGELLICVDIFENEKITTPKEDKKRVVMKNGFSKIWINNSLERVEDLEDNDFEEVFKICMDRIIIEKTKNIERRLFNSIESALIHGGGFFTIVDNSKKAKIYTEKNECPLCSFSLQRLEPKLFSFNSHEGSCPACNGLGHSEEVDLDLLIPDPNLSIEEGAIKLYGKDESDYYYNMLLQFCESENIDVKKSFFKLKKEEKNKIFNGTKNEYSFFFQSYFSAVDEKLIIFPGVLDQIKKRHLKSNSIHLKKKVSTYLHKIDCPTCEGTRLNSDSLSVKINKKSISEVMELQINQIISFIEKVETSQNNEAILKPIKEKILEKLNFLLDVGLGYLTLNRNSNSLSGGEVQRIQIASKISSSLTKVTYILDEPSTGLHQNEKRNLVQSLRKIIDLGNTVIVIEHDPEIIKSADYIIEMGQSGGEDGGDLVFFGTPVELIQKDNTLIGQYLSGTQKIPINAERRKGNGQTVEIKNINELNLKKINISIPLEKMIAVTGVSGSGKSTLVNNVIGNTIAKKLYKRNIKLADFDSIAGLENVKDLVMIDQASIGKSNRSNLATYSGLYNDIRKIFGKTKESKVRGYTASRFSYNIKGGRCEACEGEGVQKVEMSLLPDVYLECDVCHGKQFNKETLNVTYKKKNISDVLNMSVSEAIDFFKIHVGICRKLNAFEEIGLGYLKLGQSSSILSGGESQRIKLATELCKVKKNGSIYILDEPSNGLSLSDIKKLSEMLQKLVNKGNTVIIVEHNLELIKTVDHIIDLGPEGGQNGGYVIVEGTPEEVCNYSKSKTGEYLKKLFTY